LDHIADYLRFLSDAPSFWFTLNTSYDHGCHLATQFRLEPNNYEMLLIVAGLASYTPSKEGRDERQQCAKRQRRRLTGGGGVTRGDATTSRTRGVSGAQ
jgi:hypothetical protein